jgi:hypothetical protein
VFVFHQLPALLPPPASEAVDLLTPFAVVGSAAALLAVLGAARPALVLGLVAAILYVDGHGIHLAANSIAREGPGGEVERLTYFWDERLSHLELVAGWFGLLGAFCLAEAAATRRPAASRAVLAAAAGLLGFALFTSTVEGQTWWVTLAAAPGFALWALRSGRPLAASVGAAFGLAAAAILAWALAWGGVPQFSELRWL